MAILDRQLQLDHAKQLLNVDAPRYILHDKTQTPIHEGSAHCHYYGLSFNDEFDSLKHVLAYLGQLGWHDVWVEAGGRLFSNMLKHGLINRLYLCVSPCFLPHDAMDGYYGSELLTGFDDCIEWLAMGQDMIACYTNWRMK